MYSGPYYSYRTFSDMYDRDYSSRVDATTATIIRLMRLPIYVVLFLVSGYIFPLKVKTISL